MDEGRFDPLEYVSVLRRRIWWFVVPVALSVVAGVLLVWLLPRSYRATTVVAVTSARVTSNLAGAVSIDKQERMRAVSQQLLSRPVLERVVRLEHLDSRGGSVDTWIALLRSRIGVALPTSITPGAAAAQELPAEAKALIDSYELSYTDGTPEDAQRIVNRLAQVFVDANTRSREVRAQDTTAFIGAQLAASEQRLNTLEGRLRDVKESYMGRLPEQTNANLQMVSGLQRQLETVATTTRGEQDRLSMIERQIDAMQQGLDVTAGGPGTPVQTAQGRVFALERALADAQLTFTDKHPEIVRLKQELADARKAAASERDQPAADRLSVLRSMPEYRQLTKDREAAKLRIADLQRQQKQITQAIAQYQARVESAPRVEQQLASLEREYDLEREAYNGLTQKKQAALIAADLERKQGGEQFAVLVPAALPTEPFKPKPMRVLLMALVAGFVLGGAGVVGREYLDRSVHDARGLRDEFELPVLAEIPRIEPAA